MNEGSKYPHDNFIADHLHEEIMFLANIIKKTSAFQIMNHFELNTNKK